MPASKYTRAQRRDYARMVRESEMTPAIVAELAGVNVQSIYIWCRDFGIVIKRGGQPSRFSREQREAYARMIDDPGMTYDKVAALACRSKQTIWRWRKDFGLTFQIGPLANYQPPRLDGNLSQLERMLRRVGAFIDEQRFLLNLNNLEQPQALKTSTTSWHL